LRLCYLAETILTGRHEIMKTGRKGSEGLLRCWHISCAILLLCTFSWAEPVLQPILDLKAPSISDADRVKVIHDIGDEWWFRNRGRLAEERLSVKGYFSVVRPIKDFADRGDTVWEVRILHSLGPPTGVLWINEKNQKVIGLGLDQKQ
jgi:hypothetical protein